MRFGFFELVVIFAIVGLVIGPKQLPKLTDAISTSIKKMKEGFAEGAGKADNAEEKHES